MGQKNRKRYQRRLDIGSLVGLLLLGAASAAVACGFVRVKNAHVARCDAKHSLEQEIRILEKEIDSVCARISISLDRASLAAELASSGCALVPIESTYELSGMPGAPPADLALATLGDGDITYINVDNPGG